MIAEEKTWDIDVKLQLFVEKWNYWSIQVKPQT